MPEPESKVRDVAWNELCPWLLLVRSVRIALMARVLALGAAGLVATAAGWWAISQLTSGIDDPVLRQWRGVDRLELAGDPREFWVDTSADSAIEVFDAARQNLIRAPISIFRFVTDPFTYMFSKELTGRGFLVLLLCIVWELAVWGLFGGAITRIAAVKFTRDEAPSFFGALRHAARKWPSYSLPPLIALAGASLFAIQLVVIGLLMRISVFTLLMSIAWPFVILLGLMMAILLLGVLVGWPLMFATVSVEGTDAFDALSRSYAYVYHRPWRLLWYVLFAAFLAVVSMFIVKLFATSAIKLGNWSVDWGLDDARVNAIVSPESALVEPRAPQIEVPAPGAGEIAAPVDEPEPPFEMNRMDQIAAGAIRFWKYVVSALAAGYQAGFLFVAAVGIYLLLRRDIDGVQLSEVYIDQSEDYGMDFSEDVAAAPDLAAPPAASLGEPGSTV